LREALLGLQRVATVAQILSSPLPRARRRRGAGLATGRSIPIVNDALEIVGWTGLPPAVEGGRLRHAEAERLLGGTIFCTQVALTGADQIRRAGGPAGWVGPWCCLALCRAEHARGLEQPVAPLLGAAAPRSAAKVGRLPSY